MEGRLATSSVEVADPRLARSLEERRLTTRLTSAHMPGRESLERFIHTVFRRAYGANISHFMPTLLSLHDQDERVLAVCGLRRAGSGPLFLENYLPDPVEAVLTTRIGAAVARDSIVEIGNLAVTELGLARSLLRVVIRHLLATDAEWAVFTAIPALRNSLGKLNVQLEVLCDASLDQVPGAEQPDWGRYYDQQPQVMAVRRLLC
jgi:hypothetical protein